MIAMNRPDLTLICEITLASSGFRQAKILAKKIIRTFDLIKEQTAACFHYDFGLRTIKYVLMEASLLKLRALKVHTVAQKELKDAQDDLN